MHVKTVNTKPFSMYEKELGKEICAEGTRKSAKDNSLIIVTVADLVVSAIWQVTHPYPARKKFGGHPYFN